ncbi:MAG TPA: RNA-binding protein, partial [Ohtaekwangia sp.]
VSHLTANTLHTLYFIQGENVQFVEKTLPVQVQMSPVYVIMQMDYNHDGKEDLFLGGNIQHARLRFGKYDANYGTLLQGDGQGNFRYIPQAETGFRLTGDMRSSLRIGSTLFLGINQQTIKSFIYK